ncbi:hypothetical protein [Amycolatopsis sp. YIM 10]|uniref:hypothetical protein n=1 Tax=Amycolatopsis sp. YIM 10 TaxID=2653857 RepID=UPI00128FDE63|nr:hypothetical protein [Amycolatopsis sp. YIM 10]
MELPQPFAAYRDPSVSVVAGQVGGECAQAPAGEGPLECFGSRGGRRDEEGFVLKADQAGTVFPLTEAMITIARRNRIDAPVPLRTIFCRR